MAAPGTLLVRADGGPSLGAGHVMRCLALAEAWQERGGKALFIGEFSEGLRARLAGANLAAAPLPGRCPDPADLAAVQELAARHAGPAGPAWVAVDGYGFDADYLAGLRDAGARVLVLDDLARLPDYPADLVLNQGAGAAGLAYPATTGARYLLGVRFRLLRAEFRAAAGRCRPAPERAGRLLVAMGGADAGNLTGAILEALAAAPCRDMAVEAVVGPANPHAAALEALAARLGLPGLRLLAQPAMPEAMARTDLAVSAAGSTLGELAFMGVPALSVVVAPNQAAEARGMAALGAVRDLGPWEALGGAAVARACADLAADVAARRAMAEAGPRAVDGRGAGRVVDHMLGETA